VKKSKSYAAPLDKTSGEESAATRIDSLVEAARSGFPLQQKTRRYAGGGIGFALI
jgi:hypothetical protein